MLILRYCRSNLPVVQGNNKKTLNTAEEKWGGMGPPNLNLQLSRSVTTASLSTNSLENLALMKPSMYLFGHSSPLLLLPYRSAEGRVSLNPAVEGKWVRPRSKKGASSILLLLKPLPLIGDNTSRDVPDWRNSLSPLPKILSATL